MDFEGCPRVSLPKAQGKPVKHMSLIFGCVGNTQWISATTEADDYVVGSEDESEYEETTGASRTYIYFKIICFDNF